MQQLSPDTLHALVDEISRRKLVLPAIFLLEMCKPLVGCMRELCSCSEPVLRMVVGQRLLPAIQEVLSSSDRVEMLIQHLEGVRDGVVRP